MPKRIQRKRTKGWRMPPGAVYVGRPSRWGNPFPLAGSYAVWATVALGGVISPENRRRAAVVLYAAWLRRVPMIAPLAAPPPTDDVIEYGDGTMRSTAEAARAFAAGAATMYAPAFLPDPPTLDEIKAALAGQDLVCWCPLDVPCHAEVLLELANGEGGR